MSFTPTLGPAKRHAKTNPRFAHTETGHGIKTAAKYRLQLRHRVWYITFFDPRRGKQVQRTLKTSDSNQAEHCRGILVWVFALSIALAWYDFGYLDVRTAATMGLILAPLLAAAICILVWAHAHEPVDQEDTDVPSSAPIMQADQEDPEASSVSPGKHIHLNTSKRKEAPVRPAGKPEPMKEGV